MTPRAARRRAARFAVDAIEGWGLGDGLLENLRSGVQMCKGTRLPELAAGDVRKVGAAVVRLIQKLERDAGVKAPRRCRICACVDEAGCSGGCSWIEDDLCSACGPARARRRGARRG